MNERKKPWLKITREKKNIAVILGLAAVFLISLGAYAAYTNQAFLRGVLRNNYSEMVRFSSNYLQICGKGTAESGYANKVILASENIDTMTIDLYIYNYAKGNERLVNEKDITYDLKIKVSDGTQTSYKVTCADTGKELTKSDDLSYTTSVGGMTLIGRTPKSNHYTIEVPKEDLNRVKVVVTATPHDWSVTSDKMLAAVIYPCKEGETSQFSVDGSFVGHTETDSPKNYDAYNYEVSISGGKVDVTLSWKADTIEIDPFFLKKIGKTNDDIVKQDGTASIKFQMDDTNGTGTYLIPFYIISEEQIPDKWEKMEEKVTVTATQITQ